MPEEGIQVVAGALVEKFSAEQIEQLQSEHGDREFDRNELEALGVEPEEVVDNREVLSE